MIRKAADAGYRMVVLLPQVTALLAFGSVGYQKTQESPANSKPPDLVAKPVELIDLALSWLLHERDLVNSASLR